MPRAKKVEQVVITMLSGRHGKNAERKPVNRDYFAERRLCAWQLTYIAPFPFPVASGGEHTVSLWRMWKLGLEEL